MFVSAPSLLPESIRTDSAVLVGDYGTLGSG